MKTSVSCLAHNRGSRAAAAIEGTWRACDRLSHGHSQEPGEEAFGTLTLTSSQVLFDARSNFIPIRNVHARRQRRSQKSKLRSCIQAPKVEEGQNPTAFFELAVAQELVNFAEHCAERNL